MRVALSVALLLSVAAIAGALNSPLVGMRGFRTVAHLAEFELFHVIAHVGIFAIVALVVAIGLRAGHTAFVTYLLVLMGTALIEATQLISGGGSVTREVLKAALFDLFANAFGALSGLAVASAASHVFGSLRAQPPRTRPL